MPAFAGMTIEYGLNRNRLPYALGERALVDQFAKGHVFERNAQRLEQRQVGRRGAALGLAGDELAELADVGPGELALRDQVAKLARFHLGLLDVIRRLPRGAQPNPAVALARLAGIGARRVDVGATGEPRGPAYRLGRLGDGDHDVGVRDTGFRRHRRERLHAEVFFEPPCIALAVLRRAGEDPDALDRPHRADRLDLRA